MKYPVLHRICSLILVLLLCFSLSGCGFLAIALEAPLAKHSLNNPYINDNYDGWKKNDLGENITVFLPESWVLSDCGTHTQVLDENGKISIPLHIESHQATDEEMKYYSKCIGIADKEANINNATERYYSKKSKRFNEVLKRELYKRKIKCVYKTYEAYYVNLEKCEYILNQLNQTNRKKLIKDFNEEFTNMILENASKRFNKFPSKYLYCNGEDDYMLRQEGMCEMTIANETEYLGDRIKKSAIDDNYSLEIIK